MGRHAQADEDDDWDADDEPGLDDGPAAAAGVVDDLQLRGIRRPTPELTRTRRLIEQAREARELNRCLADFEDYVV